MSLEYSSSLLKRRSIAIILICIVIGAPVVIIGYAEMSFGGYGTTPSASIEVYTLQDIWYPQSHWQPYPVLIKGNMESYYARPFLMCPNNAIVEIFIEDATNSSTDYSWISAAGYAFLQDGGHVNTTLTPAVSGNFGDGEGYVANQSEWAYWPAAGLPVVINAFESGINDKTFKMTGYKSGNEYSICSMDLGFSTNTSLHAYQWSLLFLLATISNENITQVAGHGMRITVAMTITWIPVLIVGLFGSYTESINITRGDGVADFGVQDYWLYLLEGDLAIHYALHD